MRRNKWRKRGGRASIAGAWSIATVLPSTVSMSQHSSGHAVTARGMAWQGHCDGSTGRMRGQHEEKRAKEEEKRERRGRRQRCRVPATSAHGEEDAKGGEQGEGGGRGGRDGGDPRVPD